MGETSKCHKPTIRGWLTSHFMRNLTTVCPALVMAGGLLSEWSPTRCLESTGGSLDLAMGKPLLVDDYILKPYIIEDDTTQYIATQYIGDQH